MVPSDDWPNGRLDDLATEVRLVASLVPLVAKHDAEIEGVKENQRESKRTLERIESKVDNLSSAGRMTPKQWAATLGPVAIALIGAVGLVLAKGGP